MGPAPPPPGPVGRRGPVARRATNQAAAVVLLDAGGSWRTVVLVPSDPTGEPTGEPTDAVRPHAADVSEGSDRAVPSPLRHWAPAIAALVALALIPPRHPWGVFDPAGGPVGWLGMVTYSVRHLGVLHLAVNAYLLVWQVRAARSYVSSAWLLTVALAGAVAGALGHALVAERPLVGASAVIAALAGFSLVAFHRVTPEVPVRVPLLDTRSRPLTPSVLVAVVVVLGGTDAQLSGGAHLAGFVTGALVGAWQRFLLRPSRR